jgi:hypothetical protein
MHGQMPIDLTGHSLPRSNVIAHYGSALEMDGLCELIAAQAAVNHYVDRRHRAVTKARNLREAFLEIERKDQAMLESLSSGYEEGNEKYVGFLAASPLKRHFLGVALQKPSECHYEASTRILLCEIEIPDFAALRITKLRGKSYSDWVEVEIGDRASRRDRTIGLAAHNGAPIADIRREGSHVRFVPWRQAMPCFRLQVRPIYPLILSASDGLQPCARFSLSSQ